MSKKLLEVFKAPKGNQLLLPVIRKHLLMEVNSVDPDRDTSHLHVSEMSRSDWCARRAYYRVTGAQVDPVKPMSWSLGNVFAEGNQVQSKYEDMFWSRGWLWGRFKCIDCGESRHTLSPDTCWVCGGNLAYMETTIVDSSRRLIGNIDIVLMMEDSTVLVEVKTVGLGTVRYSAPALFDRYAAGAKTLDQVWSDIHRPFLAHRLQAGMYLALAPELVPELKDVEEVRFLYEWKPSQDVKEFVLTRDKALEEVGPLLEEATVFNKHVALGKVPLRPNWAAPGGAICGDCPHRTVCWADEVDEKGDRDNGESAKVSVKKTSSARRRKVVGPTK